MLSEFEFIFDTVGLPITIRRLCTGKCIGVVGDYRFYEHPYYGDESPLIAFHIPSGVWGISHWWELPRFEEIYGG